MDPNSSGRHTSSARNFLFKDNASPRAFSQGRESALGNKPFVAQLDYEERSEGGRGAGRADGNNRTQWKAVLYEIWLTSGDSFRDKQQDWNNHGPQQAWRCWRDGHPKNGKHCGQCNRLQNPALRALL